MDRHLLAMALIFVSFACASETGPEPGAAPVSAVLAYDGPLRVTPAPVRVPDTFAGCVRSLILRLENSASDDAVQIERVETPNDALRVTGEFPLRIPAGESRFIDLHFRPTAAGDGSGRIDIVTADARWEPYRLETIAVGIEPPEAPADPGPVDLVFVLDVSTTMGTMPRLRDAVVQLFDFVESDGRDVRVGLTSFVNDVLLHDGGAFLDRSAFLRELDAQLDPVTGAPDLDLPRHQLNFDFPENSLGALYRAATEYSFRPEARRTLLLITDGAFLEPPEVYSDGTPATVSFLEVGSILDERGVELVSIHSNTTGRGLSSNYDGEPSLVSRTGGTWRELADIASSEQGLDDLLLRLAAGWSCD